MKRGVPAFIVMIITIGIMAATADSSEQPAPRPKSPAKTPSLARYEVLNYLPLDSQWVVGVDVRRLASSPFSDRLRRQKDVATDLSVLLEKTGVDLARDITYVGAAGRSNGEAVAIALGKFRSETIISRLRARYAPIKVEYRGANVFMIPEGGGDVLKRGIAFLSANKIAAGDLEFLKALIDTGGRRARSVRANSALASLLAGVDEDELLWFVGDPKMLMEKSPITARLVGRMSPVRSVVASLRLTETLSGRLVCTVDEPRAASRMVESARGLLALLQVSGTQNQDVKALLDRVTISQESTRVVLTLTSPLDLLERIGRSRDWR